MGLDQYAYARKGQPIQTTEDHTYTDLFTGKTHTESRTSISYEQEHELAYWRKHPNLQGWMEKLWRNKNHDSDEQFNCVDVELEAEDLDQLECDVRRGKLPSTEGFFFGQECDQEEKDKDLEFIIKAKQYLEQDYKIVYTSWW